MKTTRILILELEMEIETNEVLSCDEISNHIVEGIGGIINEDNFINYISSTFYERLETSEDEDDLILRKMQDLLKEENDKRRHKMKNLLINERGNPENNEAVHFSMTGDMLCNTGAYNCLWTSDKPTVSCTACLKKINQFKLA